MDARSNVKNLVEVSKGKWIEMLVEKNSDMNISSKTACDNIKTLKYGFSGNCAENKSMKFRENDHVVAMTDEENAEISRKQSKECLI